MNAWLIEPRRAEPRLEESLRRLHTSLRWARWLVLDAAVVALAAAWAGLSAPGLAAALGVGAIALLALAAGVWGYRRELIGKLAIHPSAYVIPEVADYGAKSATPARLTSLSAWLREAVASCSDQTGFYYKDRVFTFRREIIELAAELEAPGARMSPPSAVECARLLTRTVDSPLYNHSVPPENLKAAIFRIRAGITSAHQEAI
jgi:hypothetical protein